MTWREQYQGGSFRGIPFVTESTSKTGGRRLAVHEYPNRDDHYVEDMGLKAGRQSIQCFVHGDDYMQQRDRLVAAFEQEGAGTLVHPYYGTLTVMVETYRVTDSTSKGGMATFDITFIKAGSNAYPAQQFDTRARVSEQADDSLSVIKTAFNNSLNTDNQPEFVTTEAAVLVSDISAELNQKVGLNSTLNNASDFTSKANALSTQASSLIRQPIELADTIIDLFQSVNTLHAEPLNAVNTYKKFFNYGDDLDPVPAVTNTRIVQAGNQTAMINLVQHVAIIESIRSASNIEFTSFNQATNLREELDNEIETHLLIVDDNNYQALNDVRIAMIEDITTRGANLARLSNFTPSNTLPALVIAHQLFQDAEKADDLIARNNIIHPGFVQGGEELEVLVNV